MTNINKVWPHLSFPLDALVTDVVVLILAAFISSTLTEGGTAPEGVLLNFVPEICCFVLCSVVMGLYRVDARHVGVFVAKLVLLITFVTIALGAAVDFVNGRYPDVAERIFAFLLMAFGTLAWRVLRRDLADARRTRLMSRVLVYGAGDAGVQFLTASMQGSRHRVVGLVDDDRRRIGRTIFGRKVFPPSKLADVIRQYEIDTIAIAMPSLSAEARYSLLNRLLEMPVQLKTVHSMDVLLSDPSSIGRLTEVSVEDLLDRTRRPPDHELLRGNVSGHNVLVTGAGGSIGSELARQICLLNPSRLILLDHSEGALFQIEQELMEVRDLELELVCVVASVVNEAAIKRVFEQYRIDVVYHAAAYKHVPMCEANKLVAFENNVLGTKNVLVTACQSGANSFTLVSTDKAVRPTNLMGASKRLAEMMCLAYQPLGSTVISMVRFGNVLGSSGSVIPTFAKQIASGGPVTVTHPEITRYFMTIPEATELVLQASTMATGGEIFILDMGEPVKIVRLAEKMIRLSGYPSSVGQSQGRPNEIEIQFTGLRPGEKLYEELLVDGKATATSHGRIFHATEKSLPMDSVEALIDELWLALRSNDDEYLCRVLEPTGYQKSTT
jgi:FlaA1/EpsC-like NDP-sugar epimerase